MPRARTTHRNSTSLDRYRMPTHAGRWPRLLACHELLGRDRAARADFLAGNRGSLRIVTALWRCHVVALPESVAGSSTSQRSSQCHSPPIRGLPGQRQRAALSCRWHVGRSLAPVVRRERGRRRLLVAPPLADLRQHGHQCTAGTGRTALCCPGQVAVCEPVSVPTRSSVSSVLCRSICLWPRLRT